MKNRWWLIPFGIKPRIGVGAGREERGNGPSPVMFGCLDHARVSHASSETNTHRNERESSTELSLQTVSSITDSVEAAAVVDTERREVIAALVVEHVTVDLGLAQLAELLVVDVDHANVDVAQVAGGLRPRQRAGVGHHASPPNGLA